MSRVRIAIIAVLIGAAAVLGYLKWFRDVEGGGEAHPVQIATFSTAIDYAPFYVARDRGFFEEELKKVGFAPEYKSFESLPPLNDSLRNGALDAVFEAEPPALIAEAAGTDVFVPRLSAVLRQQIIVRKGSGIRSIGDLRGHSVAVLTGTSAHYGLIQVLRRAGLSPTNVSIVNLSPPEARAAFQSGKIDAWAIWPPFPEVEILAGRAEALPDSEAPIVSLVVLRGNFVKGTPRAAEAIVRAVTRAQALIAQQPDEAKRIVSRVVRQPLAVVEAAWPRHDFQAAVSPTVVAQIQATSNFLAEQKYLNRAVNADAELFHAE